MTINDILDHFEPQTKVERLALKNDLHLAFSGQVEALRQYGVIVNAGASKEEIIRVTLKEAGAG